VFPGQHSTHSLPRPSPRLPRAASGKRPNSNLHFSDPGDQHLLYTFIPSECIAALSATFFLVLFYDSILHINIFPLRASLAATMVSASTFPAPVYAREQMVVISRTSSEEKLLKLYAEEMFVADQSSAEEECDAQQVYAVSHNDSSCDATCTAIERESSASLADTVVVPYLAQATTLLFDIEAQAEFQMQGFGRWSDDQVQEAAFEDMIMSQGYSLIPSTPVYSVAALNEPQAEDIYILPEQDNTNERQLDLKAELDCVLGPITGQPFLPGIEHLTNIEARSAFITYDDDIQALQQSTTEFIDDRRDGECLCLDIKPESHPYPGENFLLADNDTSLGLSAQYPTAKSLLQLINELVTSDSIVDSQPEPQHIAEAPCPGAFFDPACSEHINYTALDQLLGSCNEMSCTVCAQSVAADNVSDISHEEVDESSTSQPVGFSRGYISELPMTQPSPITQQFTAYIAFNQLLLDLDCDDILPRIHCIDDEFDEDDSYASDDILEIGESPVTDETASDYPKEFDLFDFGFDVSGPLHSPIAEPITNPRTIDSLRSYSYFRRRTSHIRRFMINTQLDDILELSSEEDMVPSSSCSDESIEFADQRYFVQPLSARRADFLDDEDFDTESVVSQSSGPPSPFEFTSHAQTESLVAEMTDEFFEDPIWHCDLMLHLTFPTTPADADPCPPPSDASLDTEDVEAVETKILGLLSQIFLSINEGHTDELQALGSDLQSIVNALADLYPHVGIIEHLGTTVEILLERIASSRSN
jgi:hypothetical protein